jgi:hypothetical protein
LSAPRASTTPKHRPSYGSENGSVGLGGGKTVSVTRPLARRLDGSGEVQLQTYKYFSTEQLFQEMALERVVQGLSTPHYWTGWLGPPLMTPETTSEPRRRAGAPVTGIDAGLVLAPGARAYWFTHGPAPNF